MFEYYEVDVKEVLTTAEGAVKSTENLQIKIEDNALRIKYPNFGEVVTLDGSVYKAQEIVFHTPAEHMINGRKYDMEMQVIHYGQTKGDIAKQVVLSFIFEKRPGVYNKFIDDVDFFTLPNPLAKARDLVNNLYIPKVFYNSDSDDVAIMKPFSFYTYQGSLTAPPCTERTIMYVAAKPIPLGSTAIQLFEEAMRFPDLMSTLGDVVISNTLPYNARGVQQLHGRRVFYYDAEKEKCPEAIHSKPKKGGHYERINKDLYQYWYVDGPKPSGMPGAMVVSKVEAEGGANLLNLNN
jgi:carbonic anhydrase